MPISLENSIARAPGCVSADLAGSVAILHPDSGLYFGLNEVGASVWNLLDSPKTGQAVLQLLLEEYEIDEETCRADLLELLAKMDEQNLINVAVHA